MERLTQPVLMIGSVEIFVSIQTKGDSDLITRIVLKLAPFVQHRKTAFQFLSNNLIQKFGKPSHHDRSRMKEETQVWALPSTTITLTWREEAAANSGSSRSLTKRRTNCCPRLSSKLSPSWLTLWRRNTQHPLHYCRGSERNPKPFRYRAPTVMEGGQPSRSVSRTRDRHYGNTLAIVLHQLGRLKWL